MIGALFKHWHLITELNKINISLIAKKDSPEKVNDFRSIIVCNVSYEFISKLLAIRLCMVLPRIIFPLQSALMPNRNIHENILILMKYWILSKKRTIKGYIAIKLDMEKAIWVRTKNVYWFWFLWHMD